MSNITRSQQHAFITEAETQIDTVNVLMCSAVRALEAAPYPEVKGPVLQLVEISKKALNRALDALNGSDVEEEAELSGECYRLFGLAIVVSAVLRADQPLDGEGICDSPLADLLKTIAELAGEDNSRLGGQIVAVRRNLERPVEAAQS